MNVGIQAYGIATIAQGNPESKQVFDATGENYHFFTTQTTTFGAYAILNKAYICDIELRVRKMKGVCYEQ
jgi:hypothetical protein